MVELPHFAANGSIEQKHRRGPAQNCLYPYRLPCLVNDAFQPSYRTEIGILQASGGEKFALQQKMQNLLQPKQLCTICTGIPLREQLVWSHDCMATKRLYPNSLCISGDWFLRDGATIVNPVFNIVFTN